MYRDHSISIVIPCLNEELSIAEVISYIPDFVDEIIVIDNASEDRTVEIARKHGAIVIEHSQNKGYGASLIVGFNKAYCDIVITGDGDNTYPVDHVRRIIDKLLDLDVDFISCRRFPLMIKESMKLRNYIGNYFFTALINVLFYFHIKDALSGMWVFRRKVLEKLPLVSGDFCLSPEIKIKAFRHPGIKAIEVPIIYDTRRGSSKLMPWKDGFKIMKFIIASRFAKDKQ